MLVVLQGGPVLEDLFQPMHLLVILGIALLVFGPKKLPELGKGLGEGIADSSRP
ncbi:MAG: twin-arginine translocase TatA/TatE family subunit [Candidatus Sulfotelmatobacter sp.]|jgi:sec-independent protein translocase protein TatA